MPTCMPRRTLLNLLRRGGWVRTASCPGATTPTIRSDRPTTTATTWPAAELLQLQQLFLLLQLQQLRLLAMMVGTGKEVALVLAEMRKAAAAARSLRMSSGSSTTTITIFIRYFYFSKRRVNQKEKRQRETKKQKLIK